MLIDGGDGGPHFLNVVRTLEEVKKLIRKYNEKRNIEYDLAKCEKKFTSDDFVALSLLGIGFTFLVCAVLLFTRVVLGAF